MSFQNFGELIFLELLSCIPVVVCLLLGQFSISRVFLRGYFGLSSKTSIKTYGSAYLLLIYSMAALWSFLVFLSVWFDPKGITPIIANIGAFVALILASPIELTYLLDQRAKILKYQGNELIDRGKRE